MNNSNIWAFIFFLGILAVMSMANMKVTYYFLILVLLGMIVTNANKINPLLQQLNTTIQGG